MQLGKFGHGLEVCFEMGKLVIVVVIAALAVKAVSRGQTPSTKSDKEQA